jgi:CubicO group peptidase (beta-lactamase class C family)
LKLHSIQKLIAMKKSALFLTAILGMSLMVSISPAQAQKKKTISDPRLAGLDAKFQSLLADWKTPGFAVAIVEKNKIVYARGFGYRDYENKIPVTPNTLFAIGSCTKAFTSSLLGILRNENKIELDKSPRTYLPELRFFNDNMDNSITIRDMMCHRTGLPRHDYSWYFFPTDSRDSLMRRIQYQEPAAGVREKYQYNNFMFMLQGMIAEKVTGKSWEDNIEERFFLPLGMSASDFSIESLEKSNDAAFGYSLRNDSIIEKTDYYHIRAMSPAGSINSSVNDMAKWVITWINGGKFEGREIIPASYVSEAMSSQMVASPALPSKEHPDMYLSNYGFGWALSSYRGHYQVQHGGAIDGFSALTCFFPTDSIGIIVLVNQDGSVIPSLVRNIAADNMLSLTVIDWNKNFKADREKGLKTQKEAESKTVSNRKSGTVPSQKLTAYTGKYFNPAYGTIKIVAEGDSLFSILPIKKLWLKHYHYDIFQPFEITKKGIDTTENSELRFNFHTSDMGEIEAVYLKMEPTLDPICFKHQTDIIDIEKGKLKIYIGDYALGEMVAKFYTKNDQTLFLFVPGQPEYELVPTGLNKFSIKKLDGFRIEFVEDAGKNITGALFIQPNGTFKATKK